MRKILGPFLSLALACFILDGAISVIDDTVILAAGRSAFALVRGLLSFASLASMGGVYVLMALTPMVPKRIFLPLALYYPLGALIVVPVSIFQYDWLPRASWVLSFVQLLLGISAVYALRRNRPLWPLVTESDLGTRAFSVWNLAAFTAANVLVAVPAVLAYLGVCASMAVDHYSGGFVSLRRDTLVVRARTYTRDDGKSIELIPMMHVGEGRFYHSVAKSFTSNSVVLLEGVTDTNDLLQTKLSYKKMAATLGLAEQREVLTPGPGAARHADVDISQFSQRTIDFLNLTSRVYAGGLNAQTIQEFLRTSQTPGLTEQFWRDILVKRNEHLLGQIKAELNDSQHLVVPWGAAHMPGMARGIQSLGFNLATSREHTILDLRRLWTSVVNP